MVNKVVFATQNFADSTGLAALKSTVNWNPIVVFLVTQKMSLSTPMKHISNRTFIYLLFVASSSIFATEIPSTDYNWDEILVIDVRSRAEWNQGHLAGSIWIPWAQIEQGIERMGITANQTLAFYCARGIRADRAIRKLKTLGFEQTINLVSLDQASATTGRLIEN